MTALGTCATNNKKLETTAHCQRQLMYTTKCDVPITAFICIDYQQYNSNPNHEKTNINCEMRNAINIDL